MQDLKDADKKYEQPIFTKCTKNTILTHIRIIEKLTHTGFNAFMKKEEIEKFILATAYLETVSTNLKEYIENDKTYKI